MGKIKDNIGRVALICTLAWCVHGAAMMFGFGTMDYLTCKEKKRQEQIIKEVNYFRQSLKTHSCLLSEESKNNFELMEMNLMEEYSDLENKLAPAKAKYEKARRRVLNPLTYLTD